MTSFSSNISHIGKRSENQLLLDKQKRSYYAYNEFTFNYEPIKNEPIKKDFEINIRLKASYGTKLFLLL